MCIRDRLLGGPEPTASARGGPCLATAEQQVFLKALLVLLLAGVCECAAEHGCTQPPHDGAGGALHAPARRFPRRLRAATNGLRGRGALSGSREAPGARAPPRLLQLLLKPTGA